jgi:hypothetical protein
MLSPRIGLSLSFATQKITYGVQRNAVLDQARNKVMAQVVPAEIGDPASLEGPFPRRLKSGGDIKDARSGSGLFARNQ